VPDDVELTLPGRPAETLRPIEAVRRLLRHCTPTELQELKLTGIQAAQRGFPVVEHDTSEVPR
jgi:hypothetical protein